PESDWLALRNQHNLAVTAWFHYFLVRLCGLGEREFLADYGPRHPCFEGCTKSGMDAGEISIGSIENRHGQDRRISHHGVARIDLDGSTIAHHHYASAQSDHG